MDKGTGITGNTAVTEAISEMSKNRTLFAEKFTQEISLKPEVVHGLQTVEDVFAHYQPAVQVAFETGEGLKRTETIRFQSVEDFSTEGITKQSGFLKQVNARRKEYLELAHLAASDDGLANTFNSPAAKQALLQWIEEAIKELRNIK